MRKFNSKRNDLSIIAAVLIFYSILFANSLSVKAYDNVQLILSETGEASPSIFPEGSPPIAPGNNISREFGIKNNTGRNYNIAGFRLTNFKLVQGDSRNVKDASLINYFTNSTNIKLEEKGFLRNETIFDGTMNELLSNDGIKLDGKKLSISKGESKAFLITVSMNASSDNRLQGIKANFGIDFSAVSDDGSSANTGGGGSGGRGTGNGGAGSGESSGTAGANTNPAAGNISGESSNLPTASAGTGSSGETWSSSTAGGNDSTTTPIESNGSNPLVNQPYGSDENAGSTNIPVSTSNDTASAKPNEVNAPSKLIKTGSFLDTETLLTLGIISSCAGLVFILKKNKTN